MANDRDDAALTSALKMAKAGNFAAALEKLREVDLAELSVANLRKAALINSYCGRLEESEQCWERVCQSGEPGLGDAYMLGCAQMDVGKVDEALHQFETEIELADKSGNAFYLSSSKMRLCHILIGKRRYKEALDALSGMSDSDGDYLPGIDQKTKGALVLEIKKMM